MRTTAKLDQWVRAGHRCFVEAEVIGWSNGAVRPILAELEVLGGSVRVDRWADHRRSLDLTIAASSPLLPLTSSSPVAPYGNELRVRMGVWDPTATGGRQMVDLGVFGIESAEPRDAGGRVAVSLRGVDRSKRIARAGFTRTWGTEAGETYTDAIMRILDWAYPGVPRSVMTDPRACPRLLWEPTRANPWQATLELARGMAAEALVDIDGQVIVRSLADAATVPVWSFVDGTDNTAVEISTPMEAEGGFNGVVVFGESVGDAPVVAVRWDDSPVSPTNYLGGYGKRPKYIQSSAVKDQATADALADAEMARMVGVSELLSLTAITHPGLDAGDIISVTHPRAGQVDSRWIIDSLEIPLRPDELMSVTARKWTP